jgi:hypothetical protein
MESDTIKCSRCDTENPGNAKYCRGCGYELPKVAVENPVTQMPVASPKKKVSLGLTIGLIIIGLVVGILLGIMIGTVATTMFLKAVPIK